jgi:hypothetical protein
MNESVERKTTPSMPALTAGDKLFIGLMVLVVVAVTGLGVLALRDGYKTEGSKRNAEALAGWMTAANPARFDANYAIAACAGGSVSPSATPVQEAQAPADANESAPSVSTNASGAANAPTEAKTWGDCLTYLEQQSPLRELRNPFTGQAPKFESACSGADYHLAGSLVLEKLVTTPAGSSIPFIASQLMPTDRIGEKLQLRLSVCDKGGYGIKVGEFEF